MGTAVTQAVVTEQDATNTTTGLMPIALFDTEGAPVVIPQPILQVTVANAIGTVGKTTTTPEPVAGQLVAVKFTNGNTADQPTVAFNGGTARQIKLGGTRTATAKITLAADGVALFLFDGTVLNQIGVYS